METQVPGLVTFPRPHFIIVVSSNDNNNWIIIITTIMIIIKVLFKNICPPPPPLLKVICRHCNTTQMFGFAGMFPEIIFSAFIFYSELKSSWWSKLFFSFLNNDFDFLEKPLTVLFSFIKMNSVFVHHFGEFITHQM